LTFAPRLRVLPAFGRWETTRPFFAMLEWTLVIVPTRQCRLRILTFALASF